MVRLCHDLRQYVAAGRLLSQMSGDEKLDDETYGRLATIRQVFGHIRDLITMELDGVATEDGVVDLGDLVADCVRIVDYTHKTTIETDLAASVTAHVNPVMLRRAVINVLDNATRAAGAGGRVCAAVWLDGDECAIEVTDDGMGFGRIPAGTGHGMSAVDLAMRSCHGRFEIASGPEAGTRVRLWIPSSRSPR